MDLLGDIGHVDQLVSAREENAVLRTRVEELTMRMRVLTVENEALRAEALMYREDYRDRHRPVGGDDGEEAEEGGADDDDDDDDDGIGAEYDDDDFVTSGDGAYPAEPAVTLRDVHGMSNPLCCALNHPDDTLLATGGSDSTLTLCRWGTALSPLENSSRCAVRDSMRVHCGAPVICCGFARVIDGGREMPVIAGGCMDGSVKVVYCGTMTGSSSSSGEAEGTDDRCASDVV